MKKVCWVLLRTCLLALIWVMGCDASSEASSSEPAPPHPYVAPLPDSRVYGVFVGVRRYARGQPVVPRPVPPEAEILQARFQEQGIVQPGQIVTLQDEQATTSNVLSALHGMRDRVRPSDTFIFFMSTHGRESHLQAYNGEVSAYDINRELGRINARAILVMINACQSGSFASVILGRNRIGLFSSPADRLSYDAVGYGGYAFLAFDNAVREMGRYSSRVHDTGAYYSDELVAKTHERYPWIQIFFGARTWVDSPIALWNSQALPAVPAASTPPPRRRHHRRRR